MTMLDAFIFKDGFFKPYPMNYAYINKYGNWQK
jgi:hypothetical protein